MADNEKMFNTYPVAEAINDDDLGMLWDITTDSCKNFKMRMLVDKIEKNNESISGRLETLEDDGFYF